MSYVYLKSESNLHTVGFYTPEGKWEPESDHRTADEAAQRVHWLNGGINAEKLVDDLRQMLVDHEGTNRVMKEYDY